MYVYMYVCIYVCMYVYVRVHSTLAPSLFSSDPQSVLNLLIQQLISRFNTTFIQNSIASSELESLKSFLYQEEILLLLTTIQQICTQV